MKKLMILAMLVAILTACAPARTAPDIFAYRPMRYAPEVMQTEEHEVLGHFSYGYEWPTRPVTVVVPFVAGGDTDIYARLLAPFLEEILGQSINIVNIDGLGGTVGMTSVYESEPDGYTVLFYHTGSMFANVLVGTTSLNFDDFVVSTVAMHCDANVFLINAELGIYTAEEFISFAQANPFELRTALTMSGFSFMLSRMAELAGDFQTVPIDVGGAVFMVPAVRGGHADVTNVNLALYMPYTNDGTLIPLWISASSRNPSIPHVPTMFEVGFEDGYVGRSYFYAFPHGTDYTIAQRLSDAVEIVVQNPDFVQQLFDAVSMPPFFVPFSDVADYLAGHWANLDGFEEYMRH